MTSTTDPKTPKALAGLDAANDPSADDPAIFVQRLSLGAANGPTVGVKDSIDIAGYPTRAGSAVLDAAPPAPRHARVVQSLLDGGCRIVGKTNMHELAYGVTGINRHTGTPVNVRHPDRVPGGSSSGSAVAVAAGLADFAVGTDTGGSIRIPATCCSVYGLKPTYGRISRDGVHPPVSSLDCVGPFADNLAQLERAMATMDPTFIPAQPPKGLRLGLPAPPAEYDVQQAVDRALASSDATLLRFDAPEFGSGFAAAFQAAFAEAFTAALTVIRFENWNSYGQWLDAPGLGEDVRLRIQGSRGVTADALAGAEACRVHFRALIDTALQHVDAIALPTLPVLPPPLDAVGDAVSILEMTRYVRPFNLTGHPAMSLPLRTATTPRLPVGLQLVGRINGDAALCAAARGIIINR